MNKHSSDMSDHSLSSFGFEDQRCWGFADNNALLGSNKEQQELFGKWLEVYSVWQDLVTC